MYSYPTQKNALYLTVRSTVFFGISAVLLALGAYISGDGLMYAETISGALKLLAFPPLFDALYILNRYFVTGFIYSVAPRNEDDAELYAHAPSVRTGISGMPDYMLDFSVRKTKMKRIYAPDCIFPLDTLEKNFMYGCETSRKSIKREILSLYPEARFYDYTKSYAPNVLVLVFRDGEGYAAIAIEAEDGVCAFFGQR